MLSVIDRFEFSHADFVEYLLIKIFLVEATAEVLGVVHFCQFECAPVTGAIHILTNFTPLSPVTNCLFPDKSTAIIVILITIYCIYAIGFFRTVTALAFSRVSLLIKIFLVESHVRGFG